MNYLQQGSLIISCQAYPGDALLDPHIIASIAYDVKQGGADGIRANAPESIMAIKAKVNLPLVGLWKQDLTGFEVYITPTYQAAASVLTAGADYVAIDCTDRQRPERLEDIFNKIREEFPGKGIVADIATAKDVSKILDLRPEFIATTLSGYTEKSQNRPRPDLDLIQEIKAITDIPVIAEGNFRQAQDVAQAFKRGAYAVVMGRVVTSPRSITEFIVKELKENYQG